jgi:ribonuclease-3
MQQLIKSLGYNFQDPALLQLALSHRSVGAHNNERLEFFGDSIVNFIIAEELYKRFSTASEGQLTRMRAQLVCADMLVIVAKELKLGDFIILGSGEQRSGGHQRASILADALEALIAAIYIDSGFKIKTVQEAVLRWFKDKFSIFDSKDSQGHKDPKTILQELLQAQKLELPDYEVVRVEGEHHEQTFYVLCRVSLLPDPVEGVGNSRRKAEQMAAEHVLVKINAQK